MPLYEYKCDACGQRFEVIQKFSDAPPDACRVCGKGPVERLLSSPAIQFKGTGWYITDYSQKGKPPAGAEGKDAGKEKDGGKDKPAGEKPAAEKSAPAETAKPAAAPAAAKSET